MADCRTAQLNPVAGLPSLQLPQPCLMKTGRNVAGVGDFLKAKLLLQRKEFYAPSKLLRETALCLTFNKNGPP
jgi:hypothetical protein